jgi:hypothetical protein
MNKLLLLLLNCLLGAGLLAGCTDCREQTCDCWSEYEDNIWLQVDLDSLQGGFRKAEVSGAYVVRYARPGFATSLDTARRHPDQSPLDFVYGGIVLSFGLFAPRTQASNEVAQYNYAVVLPQVGRRYQITDIELAGEERGNDCCRCYRNTRKRLRIDGNYVVAENPLIAPAATLRR